jgi:hypothetical protein
LFLIACAALTTPGQSGGAPDSALRSITLKGCVYPGVECLSFKSGKAVYSVAPTDKLQAGHAYRITGSVGSIGFCQEGKPILAPEKIVEIKYRCDRDVKENEKK